MSRGVQGVGVQKSVALAVRQFDEPIALVRLEPFHHGVDRRPRNRRERRAAGERGAAKSVVRGAAETARGARLRLVGHRPVVVEAALARLSKILTLAHVKRLLRPIDLEAVSAVMGNGAAASPTAGETSLRRAARAECLGDTKRASARPRRRLSAQRPRPSPRQREQRAQTASQAGANARSRRRVGGKTRSFDRIAQACSAASPYVHETVRVYFNAPCVFSPDHSPRFDEDL